MSRKNKALRAFLHQNPNPTIEQAWDAAWANQQSCFQSKRMQAQDEQLAALQAELAQLKEAARDAFNIADEAPELNMGNYDEDQVRELNNAMIEIYCLLQPLPAAPQSNKLEQENE